MVDPIELRVDTSDANRVIESLNDQIEGMEDNLIKIAKNVEKQTEASFKDVRSMMRASYAMVSGLTQVIGGPYAQIFANMFGIAMSAIGVWQGIAAAMEASGVGTAQGILMTASLLGSIMSLATGLTGQTELSKQISGLTLTLQGFGSLLDSMPFG